jgi:hypothetical protein
MKHFKELVSVLKQKKIERQQELLEEIRYRALAIGGYDMISWHNNSWNRPVLDIIKELKTDDPYLSSLIADEVFK